MSDLTKEQLKAEFDNLDSNKDGCLSIEELTHLIAVAFPKITDLNIQQIFKQMDTDDDGKVTFEESYQWWENQKNRIFSLLLSIQKNLEKAKQVIDESKTVDSIQQDNLQHFNFSFKTGDSPCKSEIGFKLSTGIKSVELSKPVRQALGLEENQPCLVGRYKVSKDQKKAQEIFTDLIQQAREVLESTLTPEFNELILEKIYTIVEPLGSEYLLFGIFSDHPLINLIFQSYSMLLNSFNFGDQCAVFDVSVQNNLDFKEVFEDPDNLIKQLVNGFTLNLDIRASNNVLKYLRKSFFDKVQDKYEEEEYLCPLSKTLRFFTIISCLINGISISVQTKDLSEFLQSIIKVPESITSFLSEVNNEEYSKYSYSMPIIQDIIDFMADYLESQQELLMIAPGIYSEYRCKVKNTFLIYQKFFSG